MEQEEAYLIDRLKETQNQQRNAYDQLERALNTDMVRYFEDEPGQDYEDAQ